ncbi:MAG: hypothetical protein QOJ88_675 [Pyrinomonadaceae bacterium]|jgi:hypothetical protein|nr:hypothetical protein [Pyrinomonadaceae bacterium]
MIPQRTLVNESYGNGLKHRVTACRRRLRGNRVARRPEGISQTDGLTAELAEPMPPSGDLGRESEVLEFVAEEVGIT